MRIAIATDAWAPQTNGVVTTLKTTGHILEQSGHEVAMITPEPFKTVPLPTYPDIRLALFPYRRIAAMLEAFAPEAIHIATEGPVGMAVRRYCRRHKLKFTTSYHTQFPEYLRLRAPIPLRLSYAFFKWFHGPAERTLVPTPSMQQRLLEHGFTHVEVWGRGVDVNLFRPYGKDYLSAPRPIFVYVGRVAVEKNIEAFLSLDLPGTHYVVGDGPDREMLQQKYPEAVFTGFRFGEELARTIAACDVFVFPSLTDTFGLVMLEAMACGVPVAAYPVTGPKDVVINGITGCLDEDLGRAAKRALAINPENPRDYSLSHSWYQATDQFYANLAPNTGAEPAVQKAASSLK
ncbi:glycosyltransferase family 1 protein [Thiohalophilus sp.]|uniref:glycosyltransferase family 4 protein n=1 Tax=Thiohalophilus sp. TaxID=3028392 RepID=UPI002ACEE7DA|nr:glycosyltransferase family 1 protein [Thiohalophilus sp.]MDZ7803998.1 glycosyltransferase family 1 protein [Thiohalophilus sp.]